MRNVSQNIIDKLDRDIENWTREEIYPYWSEEDRENVKKAFGNVNPGTLYRGLKVDNAEEFEQWMEIVNGNTDVFDFGNRMVSSTPSRFEARTFMEFTKSYHPAIMAEGMRQLIETGCAGNYASILVKFETEPHNVLWTNYKADESDSSLIPSSTAETEAFITGKIKVLEISMQLPLDKDNYEERILNSVRTPEDLKNSGYAMWAKHNLDSETSFELLSKLIEKFKANNHMKDLIHLMFNEKFSPMIPFDERVFSRFPEFEAYLKQNAKFEGDFVAIYIENGEEKLNLNVDFGKTNFAKKFSSHFMEEIRKSLSEFKSDNLLEIKPFNDVFEMNFESNFHHIPNLSFIDDGYRKFWRIRNLLEENEELKESMFESEYHRKNKEVLLEYIDGHLFDDYELETRDKIKMYKSFLDTLEKTKMFLEDETETVEELFRFFYSKVQGGKDVDMDFIAKYSEDVLPRAFSLLTSMLKEDKKNNGVKKTAERKTGKTAPKQ